jgi:cell division septation protein DedD
VPPPLSAAAAAAAATNVAPRPSEPMSGRVTPAPAPLATVAKAEAPARAAAPARFAIEFGPFVAAADAELVERRLTEAGYATVRSRQKSGATAYAVLLERVPTVPEAKRIAMALREQGINDAVVVSTDPVVLRVGTQLPLRGAVELAERVRGAGHQVRIAAQPGEASALIIRHGTFASREAAEVKRRELGQLDLPANQVVQVR